MRRLVVESGEWFKLCGRGVLRRPSSIGLVGVAILASGSGPFFAAFDFGGAGEVFLHRIGWMLQVVITVTVAVALSLQVLLSVERSGLVPVALARGGWPVSIVVGQVLTVVAVVGIYATGSQFLQLVLGAGGLGGARGLLQGLAMLLVIALMVAMVGQWAGSFSQEPAFLAGTIVGVVLLGFLRPLAVEVGGGAAWFAMLAPDFAWWAELGWSTGVHGWGDAARAFAHASVYLLVLGWLAARGMGRREF